MTLIQFIKHYSAHLSAGLTYLFILSSAVYAIDLTNKVQMNGFSSFEMEYMPNENGKGDPNMSFDADLFDIIMNIQASDLVRIVAGMTWEHGPYSEDNFGNVGLEYAFSELTFLKKYKLRAGKMFIPFGIYNEIHVAKTCFYTVKEPLATNNNDKFGSFLRFYPRWGTGVALLGKNHFSSIYYDYIIQLTNGENLFSNPYEEDENIYKAVSGRFRIEPVDGMRMGVSFYADFRPTLSRDFSGDYIANSDESLWLYSLGGQLAWDLDFCSLEGELVTGSYEYSTYNDPISRLGFSAMIFKNINDNMTPYFRYEFLDPDYEIKNDRAQVYITGVNIQVDMSMFLKIELNTVIAEEANYYFLNGKNRYNEVKASITVGF